MTIFAFFIGFVGGRGNLFLRMAQVKARPSSGSPNQPAPPAEAWQPLSFSGVAAFARTRLRRLLTVQLAAALCCSACWFWFLQIAWLPVIEKALMELPQAGGIQEGILRWGGEPNRLLDYNGFLAIAVSLDGDKGFQETSDLQLTLERQGMRVSTFLGSLKFPYGPGWQLPLTRAELEPWWLAWQPAIAVLGFAALTLLWVVAWTGLSLLYTLPGRLLTALLGREVTCSGMRRLSGAALVPGGIFLSLAILSYGAGWLIHLFTHPALDGGASNLVTQGSGRQNFTALLLAFALHWVIGWIYMLGGILRLPATVKPVTKAGSPLAPSKPRRSKNPFRT